MVKRIQDAVHGLMEFRGREAVAVELLACPEIQRLRRIRQLGLAHLVFPAAEHSRFAHALGAAHLASRFTSSLRSAASGFLAPSLLPDDELARDLVIAALCHDLGHGPLSHAWENHVIGKGYDVEAWAHALELPDKPWIDPTSCSWHELVTQALILSDASGLHHRLESYESGLSDRIAALLRGHSYLPYVSRLLASEVDVDRADFIKRDALMSGVEHGYDLNWLISTVTIGSEADNKPAIGFDAAKAPHVVERFLKARLALYETVYYHKAVKSAERMIGALLDEVCARVAENPLFLEPIHGLDAIQKAVARKPLSIEEVLEVDDYSLWAFIDQLARVDLGNETVREIARRLRVRDLFRPLKLSRSEIDAFYGEPGRAHAIADEVLTKEGFSSPDRFMLYSDQEFSFFSNKEPPALFVDTRDSNRRARPVREHPDLAHNVGTRSLQFIFVPREAVEPLTKRIKAELKRT